MAHTDLCIVEMEIFADDDDNGHIKNYWLETLTLSLCVSVAMATAAATATAVPRFDSRNTHTHTHTQLLFD